MTIVIHPPSVGAVQMDRQSGPPVMLQLTTEWHRKLQEMAKAINDQQAVIDSLTARVAALE